MTQSTTSDNTRRYQPVLSTKLPTEAYLECIYYRYEADYATILVELSAWGEVPRHALASDIAAELNCKPGLQSGAKSDCDMYTYLAIVCSTHTHTQVKALATWIFCSVAGLIHGLFISTQI